MGDLKEEYQDFLKDLGANPRFSDEEFGKQLQKLIPDIERYRPMINGIRQPYHYRLPVLKDCREIFQKQIGTEIPWEIVENIEEIKF